MKLDCSRPDDAAGASRLPSLSYLIDALSCRHRSALNSRRNLGIRVAGCLLECVADRLPSRYAWVSAPSAYMLRTGRDWGGVFGMTTSNASCPWLTLPSGWIDAYGERYTSTLAHLQDVFSTYSEGRGKPFRGLLVKVIHVALVYSHTVLPDDHISAAGYANPVMNYDDSASG